MMHPSSTPYLSIIIPAYNAQRYIDRCLASILSQSFTDYEIIIINDGSTDQTLQICKSYASKYDNITIINQPNSGVSNSRNTALRVATGKYIWFIDADDEIEEDSLQLLYIASIDNNYPELIRGEYTAIDERGSKLFTSGPIITANNHKFKHVKPIKFWHKYVRTNFFLWVMWFRRDILKDIYFPSDRTYMEDADFICRLIPRVSSMIYAPSNVYRYRKYSSSASAKLTESKAKDIALFIHSICFLARDSIFSYSPYFCKCAEHGFHTLIDYVHSLPTKKRNSSINAIHLNDLALECTDLFCTKNAEWNHFLNDGHDIFFAKYNLRNTIKSIKYRIWTKVNKLM